MWVIPSADFVFEISDIHSEKCKVDMLSMPPNRCNAERIMLRLSWITGEMSASRSIRLSDIGGGASEGSEGDGDSIGTASDETLLWVEWTGDECVYGVTLEVECEDGLTLEVECEWWDDECWVEDLRLTLSC